MRGSIFGVLALVAVCALPVAGQSFGSSTVPATSAAGCKDAPNQLTPNHVVPVRPKPQPYTAEFKSTTVKTLADGSTITSESTEVIAVDSQGRRMSATTNLSSSRGQTPTTSFNIYDPVAHSSTYWNSNGHEVSVTNQSMTDSSRNACPGIAPKAAQVQQPVVHSQTLTEELGMETIQGMEARGRRTTTTTPAGAIGNSAPLVRVDEIWTWSGPDRFHLIVREIHDDPQFGKTTKELVKFTQDEPEPSIFQPPPDYEISTEGPREVHCPQPVAPPQ